MAEIQPAKGPDRASIRQASVEGKTAKSEDTAAADRAKAMRQGNDIGTQYRSGIYTFTPTQKKAAEASKAIYEQELKKKRYGAITTEIVDAPEFYFAEDYHQQYLAKNPFGYCGLGGTEIACPIGTGAKLTQGATA